MAALLVPCTYHTNPKTTNPVDKDAIWMEGFIVHWCNDGLVLRIVVASADTGELSILSYRDVRVDVVQKEEHH